MLILLNDNFIGYLCVFLVVFLMLEAKMIYRDIVDHELLIGDEAVHCRHDML